MELKSREEEMSGILRYKQNTVCKPMFYTPNLWIHVTRVVWIAEEVCKQLGLSQEISGKIIRRCMFHDDSEIVAGDIATPEKQRWTAEQKKEYEEKCKNAIPILVKAYGNEIGEDYEEILLEMEDSNNEGNSWECSIIHAVIEYCDKLDALMEVSHELYAGNSSFLISLKDTFGIDKNCYMYVLDRVSERRRKIELLLGKSIPEVGILNVAQEYKIDINSILLHGTRHTKQSVKQKTGNDLYDLWREMHFIKGDVFMQDYLYKENITK